MIGPLTGISMVSFTFWNPVPSSPPFRPLTQSWIPLHTSSHHCPSRSQWTFSWPSSCYPHGPASWPHHALRPRHIRLRQDIQRIIPPRSSLFHPGYKLCTYRRTQPPPRNRIDILLQDASTRIRDQYARCLANQVKSSSPLTTPT